MKKIIQLNHKNKEAVAANNLTPKSMSWLVIQSSNTDSEDDADWESLYFEDIPDWVKEDSCVAKLAQGKMVNADPDGGRKWYRALKCEGPVQ